MKNLKFLIFASLLLFTGACAELETENLNNPDTDQVLGNPQDWEGIVASQYQRIWHGVQHWQSGFAFTMGTSADAITSSWGNFGMRDMSSEPRGAINNSETYNYIYFVEYPYYRFFSVIGGVNDILKLMDENPDVTITDANGDQINDKLRVTAKFMQGYAYGYLALGYDKAQFIDETMDPATASELPFDDYASLMGKAMGKIDEAINLANSAPDFSVGYWNGLNLTKAQFIALMNTFQARFLAYNARTDAENQQTNWSQVLNYAENGIQSDFAPVGDGSSWWDAYKYYGGEAGWTRIDYRVIAAMAEDTPSRFPTDNSHPLPEPEAIDNRLTTDMQYLEDIPFRANRGLYHYSHYDYTRYDAHYPGATGPMPFILKAENDLLIAEALVRTGGDKARAASLINATRVDRGGLPELTGAESNEELIEAIMHERYVELMLTGAGVPFFDRRRSPDDDGTFQPYTGLQAGTFRQMPIPARELNVLGEATYTFGGN